MLMDTKPIFKGDVYAMASVIFNVQFYQLSWRQLEVREVAGQSVKIRAIVNLTGIEPTSKQDYALDVLFVAPDSPTPAASFDADKRKGLMTLPIADFMAFVDMLRNEKPIFGHLYTDHTEWISVTTHKEPVGSGEQGE